MILAIQRFALEQVTASNPVRHLPSLPSITTAILHEMFQVDARGNYQSACVEILLLNPTSKSRYISLPLHVDVG